jgi:hypothetical protein
LPNLHVEQRLAILRIPIDELLAQRRAKFLAIG